MSTLCKEISFIAWASCQLDIFRDVLEEGNSVEKMVPPDLSVGKPVVCLTIDVGSSGSLLALQSLPSCPGC